MSKRKEGDDGESKRQRPQVFPDIEVGVTVEMRNLDDLDQQFKLRITKELGAGSFGQVFRATDLLSDDRKEYAVKVIHMSYLDGRDEDLFAKRVNREYLIAHKILNLRLKVHGQLSEARRFVEPFAISLTQTVSGPAYVLLFPYENGQTLENFFLDNMMPAGREIDARAGLFILRVAEEMLRALHVLHAHGVYHLDIKHDNILISVDSINKWLLRDLRLMDFGLSCATSRYGTLKNADDNTTTCALEPEPQFARYQAVRGLTDPHTTTYDNVWLPPAIGTTYQNTLVGGRRFGYAKFAVGDVERLWPLFDVYMAASTILILYNSTLAYEREPLTFTERGCTVPMPPAVEELLQRMTNPDLTKRISALQAATAFAEISATATITAIPQ
jgi:serine/threonine protein kinase